MRFSVVINTYNRADSLRKTLLSLQQQTHADFEVLVVNGPSPDHTEKVLAEFADRVRAFPCAERRLAVSRNIGVVNSTGDVVAFLDDDALATPEWLEELAAAYDSPTVGAVGGLVWDQTGVNLQYRFAACHRDGDTVLKVDPPLDRYLRPEADPVAYLQGTNMSFRRAALQAIGGFDENIRHFYDDVDTCLSVIDHGYALRPLDAAAVHHKVLASHVRDHRRITLDPFNLLSDRIYFGLRHGRKTRTTRTLMDTFVGAAEAFRREADGHFARGDMTAAQRDFLYKRVDEAFEDGLAKGFGTPRAGREVPPPRDEDFRPYPTVRPAGTRLRVCFVSKEYPPGDFGGPGRYTHELANGFAAAGHEVHVITKSHDIARIDLEEGAWVHRLPPASPEVPELAAVEAKQHVFDMAEVYHEVCRIHAHRPVDVVMAPLWLCEALACSFDHRFPTAITLITAMKAVSTLAEWARASDGPRQLVRFEEEWVKRAEHLHAVSHAIRERAVADYAADPGKAFISPLGMRDRSGEYTRQRPSTARLRVLYVGRLEQRKGADVFLEAAARLAPEFPNAEFVLAGKELPTDQGDTHRQRFEARFAADPALRARVTFTGMVTDEQLYQHYADCDVFCLPTYYESFGLVFVEAMMWGKPLVGSRVGGVPEVVADGEQGFLCPVGDVDAVVGSLRKLLADPDLRARFGRRSRELYETKWALPVTVGLMARQLEGLVRRHRAKHGGNPNTSPPSVHVRAKFAEVLAASVGVSPEAARSAAERLFTPMPAAVDLAAEFRKCWGHPPEEFVHTAYRLLLDREPSAGEVYPWLDGVSKGMTKADILRVMLESDEAKRRGLMVVEKMVPADLLARPHFGDPSAPHKGSAGGVARRPLKARVRGRLSRVPLLGKVFRYLRRVVYLPWNFQKMYESHRIMLQMLEDTARQVAVVQASAHALSADQNVLRGMAREQHARQEELTQAVRQLADGQAELTAAAREQVARMVDALGDISGIVEFPMPIGDEPRVVPMASELKGAG